MFSKLKSEFKDILEILRKYFAVHIIFISMLSLIYFLVYDTFREGSFIVNLFVSNIDIFSAKGIIIIVKLIICLFFMTITFSGFDNLYNNIFSGNQVNINSFFTGIKQSGDKALLLSITVYIIYFLFNGYFFEFGFREANILIPHIIGSILVLLLYYLIALALSNITERNWRLKVKRILKILLSSESLLVLIAFTLFSCLYIIISYLVIIKSYTIFAPFKGILIIDQLEYANRLQAIINIMSIITAPVIFIFTYSFKPSAYSKIGAMNMFVTGFPTDMKKTVAKLFDYMPKRTNNNITAYASEQQITYSLSSQSISFPYRVYLCDIEDDVVSNMTDEEKMIINCIYSRSCDGFVREKHVRSLLSTDYPEWVIPYIIKVCDEYVVEILQMVYEKLKDKNTDDLKQFCENNYSSFCKSYNRMISYWNEFYRCDCYNYKNYIGRKLFIECFGALRKMKCSE